MCLCVHVYESESVFVCACMRVCGVCHMCVYESVHSCVCAVMNANK